MVLTCIILDSEPGYQMYQHVEQPQVMQVTIDFFYVFILTGFLCF